MSNVKENDESLENIIREELKPAVTHTTEVMSDGKVRVKLDLKKVAAIVFEQRHAITELSRQVDGLQESLSAAQQSAEELEQATGGSHKSKKARSSHE